MKKKLNTINLTIAYNMLVAVIMIFQISDKIAIDKVWLRFMFILLFLWNCSLYNLVRHKNYESLEPHKKE